MAQEVIVSRTGDVTGDGVADKVWLTGTRTEDSPFIQDITLMIQNGVTGRITQVALQENMGYEPTILLCDFTGDGVLDIKVSIQSVVVAVLFSPTYSFGITATATFSGERYEASRQFRAYCRWLRVVVENGRGQEYRIGESDTAAADLYNPDGTLKQPTEANVGPFIMAIPVLQEESSGVCSLIALTRVYGTFAADTLGYIQDYLSWDGNHFSTVREELAIFPMGMEN